MEQRALEALLRQVQEGSLPVEEAAAKLKTEPFQDLGYARVDHHRAIRQGAAEVIFGQGKTPEQIAGIVRAMAERGSRNIIITRLDGEKAAALEGAFPMHYDPVPRLAIAWPEEQQMVGCVVIASGGTSDIPVCEEAAQTAEALGSKVVRLYDVGVAGLHRLLANVDTLAKARVIIAVAGMEGALPSVVGGLVDCPVIAVPTSVGYGANFGGVSALLSMLNGCASGVSVVNIDNGFGAGFLANRINRMKGIEE